MLTAAQSDLVAIQSGVFDTWLALQNSAKRVLLYSPGYHCAATQQDTLGYGSQQDLQLQWFDHWLKGVDNGIDRMPSVNVYGQDASSWWHANTFPVPGTQFTPYYLDSTSSGTATSLHDGSLTTQKPTAAGGESTPYLPLNGLCSNSTLANLTGIVVVPACATDNRAAELTSLTYTTPAMTSDKRFAGFITADLWAAFNRPDGSISTTLTIVHPDGRSEPVESGWLRARNRAIDTSRTLTASNGEVIRPYHPDTQAAAQDVPVGQPERYLVQINPGAAQLHAGDRLRLVISTTDAGLEPSLSQTLASLGSTMTIVHGPAYPSHITIPFIS